MIGRSVAAVDDVDADGVRRHGCQMVEHQLDVAVREEVSIDEDVAGRVDVAGRERILVQDGRDPAPVVERDELVQKGPDVQEVHLVPIGVEGGADRAQPDARLVEEAHEEEAHESSAPADHGCTRRSRVEGVDRSDDPVQLLLAQPPADRDADRVRCKGVNPRQIDCRFREDTVPVVA